MKAVVAAFNQEKALVGAFSAVITNLRMELFQALLAICVEPGARCATVPALGLGILGSVLGLGTRVAGAGPRTAHYCPGWSQPQHCTAVNTGYISRLVLCSAPSVFTITEKALTRAFSRLKAPYAFT